MIPILCVILFFILGLWILADPLPGILILNLPEIIGRLVIAAHYTFVAQEWVVNSMVTVSPETALRAYIHLSNEIEDMYTTPLAHLPEYDDDDDEDV